MKLTYIWGAGHYGVLTALDCEQKGVKVAAFVQESPIGQPLGKCDVQPLMVLRKFC